MPVLTETKAQFCSRSVYYIRIGDRESVVMHQTTGCTYSMFPMALWQHKFRL